MRSFIAFTSCCILIAACGPKDVGAAPAAEFAPSPDPVKSGKQCSAERNAAMKTCGESCHDKIHNAASSMYFFVNCLRSCRDDDRDASQACRQAARTSAGSDATRCRDDVTDTYNTCLRACPQYGSKYDTEDAYRKASVVCHDICKNTDDAGENACESSDSKPIRSNDQSVASSPFTAKDGTPLVCTISNIAKGIFGTRIIPTLDPYACNDGCTKPTPFGWTIAFKPQTWSGWSAGVQKFLFAHECGHVNANDMLEQSANCWGAEFAAKQYNLTGQEWAEVEGILLYLFPTPNGPYPDGASQVAVIERCRQ
jgi:hypothetical protein